MRKLAQASTQQPAREWVNMIEREVIDPVKEVSRSARQMQPL